MNQIIDADREAAQILRILLADISGFWFKTDDDGPLCAALARHRIDAEQRVARKLKSNEERVYGPNTERWGKTGRLVSNGLPANARDTPAAA